MTRQIIETADAPAAVGPYSQAVARDGLIYSAGQIGLDPATGKLVEGGIQDQTRQALTNLQAILQAAGASLGDVLKTTVFLQDIGDRLHKHFLGYWPSIIQSSMRIVQPLPYLGA